MIVLALNSGSSSLKAGLYRMGATTLETLLSQEVDAVASLPGLLAARQLPAPEAIGHRVVHGGPQLLQHCLIDDQVLAQIAAASPFAPVHTPAALAVIREAGAMFPRVPQAACLDTVFHAGMPDIARVLPLPRALADSGIRRYGFHGLSCESVLHQLALEPGGALPARLVIAHLGNGASVTAVLQGRSVDTSMGLTPAGGIIMGTRCGDLDPGVLVHLMRSGGMDASALEDLVDRQSGLLGVSGLSHDMRVLHAAAAANAGARLAIDMFCQAVRKQVAAMACVLGGVDMLAFTGGIGENDAVVRDAICHGLEWMGVGAAAFCVRVVPCREDEQIARHTFRLLAGIQKDLP